MVYFNCMLLYNSVSSIIHAYTIIQRDIHNLGLNNSYCF